MSILLAARELHLTSGAVSRQIKNLETFLGCELFVRSHRKIAMTEEGKIYWATIRSALSEIRAATEDISQISQNRKIVIGCPRLFLQKCIMPQLRDFYASHPGIEVKFTVSASGPPLERDIDAQILIGDNIASSNVVEKLVACDLALVCSPTYLATNPAPKTIDELTNHTLLRSIEFTKNWEKWLGHEKQNIFENTRFIDFDNAGFELSAALEGLGIAIVRLNLVQQEISKGELLTILPQYTVPDHYSLIFPPAKLHSNNFKIVRRWLKQSLRSAH